MRGTPDEELTEDDPPARKRRSFAGRLLRLFIALNAVFALISFAVALYIKLTHPSVGDADSDELDLVTIFDGLDLTSRATSFRGGSWITMFGGGELDLRGATLDPSGATLRVRAIMGGGDIQVPDDWNVELSSKGLMGGAAVKRPNATDDPYAPTLRIEARTIMGGFGVTSGD